MTRLLGITILMMAAASYALAAVAQTPEIDATSAVAAVGLLGGGLLVLRARRKK